MAMVDCSALLLYRKAIPGAGGVGNLWVIVDVAYIQNTPE